MFNVFDRETYNPYGIKLVPGVYQPKLKKNAFGYDLKGDHIIIPGFSL